MNDILAGSGAVSMTSREIAELTGKRHADVLRDIDNLLKKLPYELRGGFMPGSYSANDPGQAYREYVLDTEAVATLVSGYSPILRAAVLKPILEQVKDFRSVLAALRDFDLPDDLPDDLFVYAIRENDTGNIKLGISRDPHKRLAQLQTGNSSELELVAYRPAVNRFDDERAVHSDAAAYRLRGEWFKGAALEVMQ